MNPHKIRALVVDDFSVVRHAIREVLKRDVRIEVVSVAAGPYEARARFWRSTWTW